MGMELETILMKRVHPDIAEKCLGRRKYKTILTSKVTPTVADILIALHELGHREISSRLLSKLGIDKHLQRVLREKKLLKVVRHTNTYYYDLTSLIREIQVKSIEVEAKKYRIVGIDIGVSPKGEVEILEPESIDEKMSKVLDSILSTYRFRVKAKQK